MTEILQRTVTTYESPRAVPWTFDADSEFARNLLLAIVAFRVEITRLEGKWKLSQNHPRERREKVIQALRGENSAGELAIAGLMAEKLRDTTSQ